MEIVRTISKDVIVCVMKYRKIIFLFEVFRAMRAINIKVLISMINHRVRGSDDSSEDRASDRSVREIILLWNLK